MSADFINCPECKRALPAGADECTNCHHKFNTPAVDYQTKKRCTYCGEEVLAAAIKCKHCGSDLSETPAMDAGNKLPVESKKTWLGSKKVIATLFGVLILAFTNPSQPDFNKFVSDKLAETNEGQTNTGFDKLLSGVAVFAISNMTERRDFMLFSLYNIDTSLIRAFNPDTPNRKFVGVLGQFIPLSTSICDYIGTAGTNCGKENIRQEAVAKRDPKDNLKFDGPEPAALDKIPSWASAFEELFGVFDPSGKVKTAPGKLTSLWLETSFKDVKDDIHVKFFKSQTLDASGEVESCHACGIDISAITYKKVGNQWRVISRQIAFGVAGEYGDEEEDNPELVRLSSNVIALMLESTSGGMGYFYEGKMLLTFSNNTWRKAGIINTGADNSADCEDEERAVRCWGYKGKISVVAGENVGHPSLLVTRTGTGEDFLPIRNVTYSFEDGEYREPQFSRARVKKLLKQAEETTPVSRNAEMFVVQVAALSDANKASSLKERLSVVGLPVYTDRLGSLIRVRVGPYPSREAAISAAEKLAENGVGGQILVK